MDFLRFAINHVALPPRLPQEQESDFDSLEAKLTGQVTEVIEEYRQHLGPNHQDFWMKMKEMMSLWVAMQQNFDEKKLEQVLMSIKCRGFVALPLFSQNAVMLVRSVDESSLQVDAFEVSASNSQIMSTVGRLSRTFPAKTVELPTASISDKRFLTELVKLLRNAHEEKVEISMPHTKKAKSHVDETRETRHPCVVTEYAMSLLAAQGRFCPAIAISKQVREDVLWKDCLLPWRRSPAWLATKVVVQLCSYLSYDRDPFHSQYKNFMLFFIGKLAQESLKVGLDAELLFVLNTKLARRLFKGGDTILPFVKEAVQEVVSQIRAHLDCQWLDIQKNESFVVGKFETTVDSSLALRNSRACIEAVLSRDMSSISSTIFEPRHPQRGIWSSEVLPTFESSLVAEELLIHLSDIEYWVDHCVKNWMHGSRTSSDCTALKELILSYSTRAREAYQISVREKSYALLTVMDLWLALDHITSSIHPLLLEFRPEIPEDFLCPLLLPSLRQMQRLKLIEKHITDRSSGANQSAQKLYGDSLYCSFAVRYFQQSPILQNLCGRIERDAETQRTQKHHEWQQKSFKYQSLMDQSAAMICSEDVNYEGLSYHPHWCTRCSKIREAESMRINVHEWPLPMEHDQKNAVVFELQPPAAFIAWRDVTWHIIFDLGVQRAKEQGTECFTKIRDYASLSRYLDNSNGSITLGSYTKPFIRSHYSTISFPARFDQVCVNNGLRFRLRDGGNSCWTSDQSYETPSIKSLVTFSLQSPYRCLQWTIESTTHSQNELLSCQADCPADLQLKEYLTFGSLRIGEKLQWINILRDLGSNSLSFSAEPVGILIRQAIWEAGTPGSMDVSRKSHTEVTTEAYSLKLCGVLKRKVEEIRENWQEVNTMAVVVVLATRAVSLSNDGLVKTDLRNILRKIRSISLGWCRDILTQSGESDLVDAKGTKNLALLRSALTSLMTFDMEDAEDVLEYPQDVADYIESLIRAHDSTPSDKSCLSMLTRCDLLRSSKISLKMEAELRRRVGASRHDINCGIKNIWSGANCAGDWTFLAGSSSRWIMNSTNAAGDQRGVTVHLNILTGEFLVDGKPVGRVPDEYKRDSLFRMHFGKLLVQVTTSTMPGMVYMMAQRMFNHEVHFAQYGGVLLIRAVYQERVLELLRPEIFSGDIPAQFSEQYVHWIDLESKIIDFRPRDSIWDSMKCDWKLYVGSPSTMVSPGHRLLDYEDPAVDSIVDLLSALDEKCNIHVTLTDTGSVEAELPHLGLHFFINSDGNLQCRELHAVVDMCQDIGCLYGLRSKLVFRNLEGGVTSGHQSVVIPIGPLRIERHNQHRTARVSFQNNNSGSFVRYSVDTILGRLRSAPSLIARLWCSYLHAITAYLLPDPLTGLTGTEEALKLLSQCKNFSTEPLEPEALQILGWIAGLTPRRSFYPDHLKVMQKAEWNEKFTGLAQHENFKVMADSIMSTNARFRWLHDGGCSNSYSNRGSEHLRLRAEFRNAAYRRSTTMRQPFEEYDRAYKARDTGTSDAGERVYSIACLVNLWPSGVQNRASLEFVRKWKSVAGYGSRFTISSLNELNQLALAEFWGALFEFCRHCSQDLKFKLTFMLAPISYAQPEATEIINILLTIAFSGRFTDLVAPFDGSYELTLGNKPDKEALRAALFQHGKQFQYSGHAIPKSQQNADRKKKRRQFDMQLGQEISQIVESSMRQWPCAQPVQPTGSFELLNLGKAMKAARMKFSTWYRNWCFSNHLTEVEMRLRSLCGVVPPRIDFPRLPGSNVCPNRPYRTPIELAKVLFGSSPPILSISPEPLKFLRHYTVTEERNDLENVIEGMKAHRCTKHVGDLQMSVKSLQSRGILEQSEHFPCSVTILEAHVNEMRTYWEKVEQELKSSIKTAILQSSTSIGEVLSSALLLPSITCYELLHLLGKGRRSGIGQWASTLVRYGEAVASFQRAERLVFYYLCHDFAKFSVEAANGGRDGWDATNYPEWLLLEIENDICIRETQAQVAQRMMNDDEDNSVLQLNMGEGKSSVILPMIAAASADSVRLVRIMTLKPLIKQAYALMAERLGGLIGQKLYCIPFSRQTPMNVNNAKSLLGIFQECSLNGDVILTLPEHILSLRLMRQERIPQDISLANELRHLESWLQEHACDFIDECDLSLDPRFQLTYAVGGQKLLEGAPHRWEASQGILRLLSKHAIRFAQFEPRRMEAVGEISTFPRLRFFDSTACDDLLSLVAKDAASGLTRQFSFLRGHAEIRSYIDDFIQKIDPTPMCEAAVREAFAKSANWDLLLLLRGLFANQVLRHTLTGKRWAVDYGLDLTRCLMAVPYRSKGVPSPSAEFGHPDVAILFTCLSYYYTGLDPAQARQTFELLFKDSDGANEFSEWVSNDPKTPSNFQSLRSINMEDSQQCQKLFAHFCFNSRTVDYFLTRVVFPREGKEFAERLSTSAWDLPSVGTYRTAGFSGTNDIQTLLPLNIKQKDIAALQHTNAMVLNTILQRENRSYRPAVNESGHNLGTDELLAVISSPECCCQVLIDVGAQIIDVSNEEVAQMWLSAAPESTKAAIYFDHRHETMALDRSGRVSKLVASPYYYHMEECVFYLDEAHARGVDLPIPKHFRAAIYLGPGLRKDKLVQGIMRMRRLGFGQSIMFFAPLEVHREIVRICRKADPALLDSSDVVLWSMIMTERSSAELNPLWFKMAFEHLKRRQLYTRLHSADDDQSLQIGLAIREPDACSIEEMYDIESSPVDPTRGLETSDHLSKEVVRLWKSSRISTLGRRAVAEEQIREIAVEVQRECQIERPPKKKALPHSLHRNVLQFAQTGMLPEKLGNSILPASKMFHCTSAASLMIESEIFPDLFISGDFARTVECQRGDLMDDYLRPVRWVISSAMAIMIVSPFEVNMVIDLVRCSSSTALHSYTPRVFRDGAQFAELKFYSLPSRIEPPYQQRKAIVGLNLAAGLRYFETQKQYEETCKFLGVLAKEDAENKVSVFKTDNDGFVALEDRDALSWGDACGFNSSPIPLIRQINIIRNPGDCGNSHIRDVVSATLISHDDFVQPGYLERLSVTST